MKPPRILIGLLIFTTMAPLAANDWIPTSVIGGSGNDSGTYGISSNNDDGRSFGGMAKVTANAWWADVTLDGYTNRGYRSEWDKPETFYQGRLDVLQLTLGLFARTQPHQLPPWLQLGMDPYAGVVVAGNLGLQSAQNLLHTMIGRKHVDLPYDTDSARAFLRAGAHLSCTFIFPTPIATRLAITGTVDSAVGYYFGTDIQVSLSLGTVAQLHGGYYWKTHDSTWRTANLVFAENQGWNLGFTIQAGFLYMDYFSFLQHGSGYGVMGIDVMNFFLPKIWKRTTVQVSSSMALTNLGLTYKTLLEIPIGQVPGLITAFSISYKGHMVNEGNSSTPRERSDNGSYLLHVGYQYPLDWVTPYAMVGVGASSWNMTRFSNAVPTGTTAPMQTILRAARPTIDLEIGGKFLRPGMLSTANATYQITLYGGLSYTFGTDSLVNSLSHEPAAFARLCTPWVWRIGVGIAIGMDE